LKRLPKTVGKEETKGAFLNGKKGTRGICQGGEVAESRRACNKEKMALNAKNEGPPRRQRSRRYQTNVSWARWNSKVKNEKAGGKAKFTKKTGCKKKEGWRTTKGKERRMQNLRGEKEKIRQQSCLSQTDRIWEKKGYVGEGPLGERRNSH